MGKVEGKVAFVTGAARGQGRSHAVRLAEEGADIIAIDLCEAVSGVQYGHATEEDLAETVRQVEALGRRIVARKVDVRNRAEVQSALRDGVAKLGQLSIAVANAAICVVAPWDETTPEIWDETIGINLGGTWNTVQLSAPYIKAAGGGSIVLISSVAGLKAPPFLTAYTASKHGVTGLARAFAHELGEHKIRVNSVHPGAVDTPMGVETGALFPPLLEKHPQIQFPGKFLPVGITESIDQSNVVLFLASDEARYITGQALTVDGGRM